MLRMFLNHPAELKQFDPFLGKFNVSGKFAKLQRIGTLELKRAIKGWYFDSHRVVSRFSSQC